MPEKSIIDQIKHYQRDIVKCPGDYKRMIRCIERLTILPVTIAHLQETGVGRSVNELRKCGGEVGAAASSLVCKWKSMVKDSDSEESDVESSVENSKSSTEHKSSNSSKKTESSQNHKKPHNSAHHKKADSSHNSHNKSESRHHENKSSKDSSKHKHSSRSSETSHRGSSTKSGHRSSTDSKQSNSHRSKTDHKSRSHKNSVSHDSDSDCNESGEKSTKTKHDKSTSNKRSSSSLDNKSNNSKYKEDRDKHRKEDRSSTYRSSKKYDEKRIESDSSDDEVYKPTIKKRKTEDSNEKHDYKNIKKHSKTSVKKRNSSDESDSKSETDDEKYDNKEKVHIKSADSSDSDNEDLSADNNSDDEQADSDVDERQSENNEDNASEKYSEENNSEMNESSSSEEEEEYVPVKIKQEKVTPERELTSYKSSGEKSISNHIKNKYTSNSQTKNHIKQEKDGSIKIKKEKDNKSEREEKYKSDTKQNKESKPKSHSGSKDVKKVKVKIEKEDDGSIDCVSGASFADALLGLSDTKKKLAKKKTSSPTIEKLSVEKNSKTKSSSKTDKRTLPSTSSSSSKTDFREPDLLSKNVKLEPLDVDLKATLPEITPNYKPLPHYSPPASPPNKRTKLLSQEDALSSIMSQKNQRTRVYSGNKTGFTKVPSLFDLCIQVLQNNIEGLEYTGGVPYDLLKPVLDRATADQLHQLEYYNPYLVEDTDSLWKFHCKKEFRGKEPEEFETWRELYLRSLDERERKLKALKENITQSIAKSTPIRQTKLAYIDSVVKPPRNVARQQMKMGTGKAGKHEIVSKSMVGTASGTPVSEAVKVPPPPKTSSSSQFPIPNFLKKKKAPLMAKALQLIKGNRFKR